MDIKKLRQEWKGTTYGFTKHIAKQLCCERRSVYHWLEGKGMQRKFKHRLIEIYGESKAETKGETDND